jgi:hypothetical protein
MPKFPNFQDSSARVKIADLERLMDTSLTNTQYVDGARASRLLGVVLSAFRDAVTVGDFVDRRLASALQEGNLFGLALAASFDLAANIEYLHGRVVNAKWIYCHRADDVPRLYYSFLKQCPRCCLDLGLEARLSGAQHKPTSHHIGEITTVLTALILQLITAANDEPLTIATITKQSHDVDAIGYRDGLLVLFEIKSSPMVTFPLATTLLEPLVSDDGGDPVEYRQHALVDMVAPGAEFELFIPHADWSIPLGSKRGGGWPYDEAIEFFGQPENFIKYLSAWIELYDAYRIPKVQRTGRSAVLAYLVNGWGDEIDSNKTKPGLGRTDDIKKGTYQLIKFGAYYRDDASELNVRAALVANLDPLFLRQDYLDKLLNVRWAHEDQFVNVDGEYRIPEGLLKYLYDAIVTFNRPDLNDPILRSMFDLEHVAAALLEGHLDHLLDVWVGSGPDAVVAEVDRLW